ncbi:hypothetical protein B9Z55_012103 [Caenorhabditis nigoni]|uniref:SCP domain-containing protein n=1 Tax=Caenorhabditis nigoni TaxID=1611254 RepID=A0A2G5TW98_9PELO|nr:hypothetical protein B9Z55_012103 [Caenorhabditis nigoni]
MKGHFSVGILFLFCAYGTIGAFNLNHLNDADFKEKAASLLNKKRLENAKQGDIANMHELSYDNEMEKSILNAGCTQTRGHNFVVVTFKGPGDLQEIYDHLQNKIPTRIDLRARRKTPDCHDAVLTCAVGPKNKPSETDVKHGPPGSACPNGKTASGLCKSGGESGGLQGDVSGGKGEDNASNHSSLIALLLIVLLI